MSLGAFSISLNVKDLGASRAFYHTLGFADFGGGMDKGYVVLKNGATLVGLYQGFIPANTLTFNPGWDQDAAPVAGDWEDVRAIQARLQAAGLTLETTCDPEGTGPAYIVLTDPDGNPVLIDQHR